MLNNICIYGRLVRDPEMRTTGTGVEVASFTVAVDRDYNKPGEEKQTDFFDCTAWRKAAAFVCQYFKKGSAITVQGSMQSRKYEDKEGNKRTAWEIQADKVGFGGKKSDTDTADTPYQKFKQAVADITAAADGETVPNDDDLPF